MNRNCQKTTVWMLPVLMASEVRLRKNPSRVASLWKSRAFALGIHNLGGVGRKGDASFTMGLRNHVKDAGEFGQSGLASGI